MSPLTQLPQWQTLLTHQQEIAKIHLRDLFHHDTQRFDKFSLEAANLLLDFSKNHINETTIKLLCELAKTTQLQQHIADMFDGKTINTTEHRPALHIALRNQSTKPILVNGNNVMPTVNQSLAKMTTFSEQIRSQQWRGYTQQPITDIINIGVGGSDVGPNMVVEALAPYVTEALRFHFINNIDSSCITQTLKKLSPATTLFIISSKSFTTLETLTNAKTALRWFQQAAPNQTDAIKHFIAVTNKPALAEKFGIDSENIFTIEDWVGGRYSLWSAIGLPIMLAIGADQFKQLLAGAYAMDEHFRSAPLQQNMPVVLGFINVWYNNFFGTRARAISPYTQLLKQLPHYLQQAEMESTGKHVTADGQLITYASGQIIFGEVGTNSQHTFNQLLHQGTQLIPVDFIVPMRSHYSNDEHHAILVANAFGQSKALAEGKMLAEVLSELHATGYTESDAQQLAPHKVLTGNRPSNSILMPQLTPNTLGALIALYEHKIFVQSVLWQINAFDQWGVELGKQLATVLLPNLLKNKAENSSDNLTHGLLQYYQMNK